MNHRVASLFLCILFSVVSLAQSSMISVSRDARLNRTAQLGGKAGVLFHSKSPDLVISTTVNSDPKVTMPKALGNNVYEYEMLLDVSGAADRVFKVSKKGSVISTKTGQVLLKANAYVGFNVDIVEKPIYMELSDEGGHYILHGNGWALIEINSEIKITPNYNSKLKLEHRSSRSVAGVYVDSLIINVELLQNLHARLETVSTELDKLNAEYDNLLARNTSEGALNRLDKKIREVETTVSSLSKELDELSYISVKGEGTNERVIDAEEILALKSKEKRKYNVILQSKPQDGGAAARPSVTSQYVLFKVTPNNAMVELDGQMLEVVDGTTTKRMPFGTYSYRVQAPRHAVKSGTIVVNDPKSKHIVNISLEPQYVNAKFSVANNAEIWVDEQKRGTGSCTLELGYGAYLVECRLPGHKPSQQEVLIGKGSDSGVITLTPPTPVYGSVDINSTPADAEVWMDGKKLGTTPLFLSESLVGEHKLKVCKLGYKDQTATIVVAEGQTTASSITLEKGTPNNDKSSNIYSDDARIMQFLRSGLRITGDGTAIDKNGHTTFNVKVVDDNHFSVSVSGSTAYSSFTNRTLVMKLSNGRGVVTNDELRRCRYNSFTASFTITGNKLTVYLSYTTTAYGSYSVKREYTLKDIEGEEQTPEGAVSPNANVRTFTVNGVSFQMVFVEGGTFRMGSDSGDSDEKPVHDVTLSNYCIGKTEVTQALWRAVMGTNPSHFKGDNLPVENVSWNDCQTFIKKLNAITGANFRLPTEAEWEYAARGGKQSKNYTYSGSNDIGTVAWSYSNSSSQTHPVGQKQPNELGIYDMSGNVWEWCSDWYSSYSRYAQTNPSGATSGPHRVCRGGSWYVGEGACSSAYRDDCTPDFRCNNLGFRLALPIEAQTATIAEPLEKVFPSEGRTLTVNGVSFDMVFVEGGTFRMGSDSGDSDEKPVHDVTLSNYSIGKTEVTQALWRAVMGTNPSHFKGDNLPVENVSWNDCQTFIKKLNAITGANFRLPTEAEWEYAARGGKQSKNYTYSGSNDIGAVAWYYSNSSYQTHPVGLKQPNELGIYDMSGNVLEWCSDRYGSYGRYAQTNPSGATRGYRRVCRGGSWYYNAGGWRSTNRNYGTPDGRSDILGFRLALSAL